MCTKKSSAQCSLLWWVLLNLIKSSGRVSSVLTPSAEHYCRHLASWNTEMEIRKEWGKHSVLRKICLPKTFIKAINICLFPKLYNHISNSSINAGLAGLARGLQIKFKKKGHSVRILKIFGHLYLKMKKGAGQAASFLALKTEIQQCNKVNGTWMFLTIIMLYFRWGKLETDLHRRDQ